MPVDPPDHTPRPDQLAPVADPPGGLAEARVALHRLAAYVIGPARHRACERFGLRWSPRGFTTPVFDGRRIEVDGDALVDHRDGGSRTAPLSTIAAGAEFLGEAIDPDTAAEHDTPALDDADAPLPVSPEHVTYLANWWGIGVLALETVVRDEASTDPGEVQLWPGHLDVGVEIGDDDRRASYGASPGDDSNPVPYLYVSVWWPERLALATDDPFWTARGYVGASATAHDLAGVDDPVAAAIDFYRRGRDLLLAARLIDATSAATSPVAAAPVDEQEEPTP